MSEDKEKDLEVEATEPTSEPETTTAEAQKVEPKAKQDAFDSSLKVVAKAKYVRSSARKARLVCDHIRGKSVDQARAVLANSPRTVSEDWTRLLNSAVANAENNHGFDAEELYIDEIYADEGPTLKRSRPRAMGRATPIHKRTSHLSIALKAKQ